MKTLNSMLGFMPDKHLNIRRAVVRGGGGGGTITSSTSIPEWAEPAAKDALNTASGLWKAGGLSHVQNLTPEQTGSLDRTLELSKRGGVYDQNAKDAYSATQAFRDAAGAKGLWASDAFGKQLEASQPAIQQAVQQTVGQQQGQFARQGALGSARADALSAKTSSDLAQNIAGKELTDRRNAALSGAQGVVSASPAVNALFGYGAQQQGQVGSVLQNQAQREGDSAYQGASRFFGLLNNPAIGSTTTQRGGGGK